MNPISLHAALLHEAYHENVKFLLNHKAPLHLIELFQLRALK